MNRKNIILTFKIASYNFLGEDKTIPNEMNLTLTKKVDEDENFLKIVTNIANRYKLDKNLNYYLDDIYRILWSEHFSDILLNDLLNNIDEHNYSPLDVKVGVLDNQFNLENKIIKILILATNDNYFMKFFFRINRNCKNHIPHVHCSCCGIERKIDLVNIEFIGAPFISRTLSCKALNIVNKYQKEFICYWESFILHEEQIEFNLTI